MLVKHVLVTVSTILISSRQSNQGAHEMERIIADFIQFRGLECLEVAINNPTIMRDCKKEFTSIVKVLDGCR